MAKCKVGGRRSKRNVNKHNKAKKVVDKFRRDPIVRRLERELFGALEAFASRLT